MTDNFNDLKKWPIPVGTKISAGGFLVVFADGKDAKPGQRFTRDFYPCNVQFTTKRYHTNFNLSADGDEIALCISSGAMVSIVDSVIFFNQLADISTGRNPSANNTCYLYELTPGNANTTDAKKIEQFSGSVQFSIPEGFYYGSQIVSLTSTGGEIYYTLNFHQ